MKKIILPLILLLASASFGKEIGGVNLPDTLKAGDAQLSLNGAGLRKKLFIKVYAGGLYLQKPSKDASSIVAADEPMAIRMHFIYDGVDAKKLIDAWNEGFDAALGSDKASLQKEIDAFNGLFTKEAKEGDIYDVVYVPGNGVEVILNGTVLGKVEGMAFKKAVFSIWLGENVDDLKSLKKSMLGK